MKNKVQCECNQMNSNCRKTNDGDEESLRNNKTRDDDMTHMKANTTK